MLAKRYRLPIQFFVGKKASNVKSRYFLLKIFPTHKDFSRFGIVISSKVSRKAVERNRLKRQVYNFLREIKEQLPPADYLIIALPAAAGLKKNELLAELFKTLNPKP